MYLYISHFKVEFFSIEQMFRVLNWVLLQLAMVFYGDSSKEFQIEND